MSADMQLTATQSAALAGVIATHLEESDFETVLERCFAQRGIKDLKPINATLPQISMNCMMAAQEEGYVSDYLRRVLEHKWIKEKLRYAVLDTAPEFAKPMPDIDGAIAAVEAGLHALLDGLQNPAIFTAVGEQRKQIIDLDRALGEFEACKRLHDQLHMLQIKGAPWLGADDPDDAGAAALLPIAQFAGLIDTAAEPPVGGAETLPDGIGDAALVWTANLKQAAAHLTTGIADAVSVVSSVVRRILSKEPARLNDAMFAVTRDLPIKQLHAAFSAVGLDPAAAGARQLGDAIRGRIAEHSLWQEADAGFYRIESICAFPDKDFLVKFDDAWRTLCKSLFRVTERAISKTTGIDSGVNAALVTYDRALTVSGKTPSSADVARLEAAAQALRLQAALLGDSCRLKFFAVDGALKADCARLLALRLPLSVLLGKVPLTWRLQVPP